jgi:hypothetical protein
MRKRILVPLILLFGPSSARAVSIPALTYQTGVSSITVISPMNVSTSPVTGATQMDNPQLPGRVVLEIQDVDSAGNLWCVAGSSAALTGNTGIGREVLKGGGTWVVSVMDAVKVTAGSLTSTPVKFFCLSDGVKASSATVTQLY